MDTTSLVFADTKMAEEIARQTYPSASKLTVIDYSYDNIVVLINEQFALRFPRNKNAYARSQYEKQILQHLETLETVNIPHILDEHINPPYLVTTFVTGKHLSPSDICGFSTTEQRRFGEDIAVFAHKMHTALPVDEARHTRKKLGLDELSEEPWPIYFERHLSNNTLLTSDQAAVANNYYDQWRKISSSSPLVVVHDDLHTENMLFKDNRLCGVLDFGDTNIGTAEQDLRQLYRINDTVVNAAARKYSELSGRQLDVEALKLWAIMQELASYAERLATNNTNHHAFARSAGNLNKWLKTDIWGKGMGLPSAKHYQ